MQFIAVIELENTRQPALLFIAKLIHCGGYLAFVYVAYLAT